MSKTPFSNKCDILGELWLVYREEAKNIEAWSNFFDWADVGLPMAYLLSQNLVSVKKTGKAYVEDVWNLFCDMLSIDTDAQYNVLSDCFDSSPHYVQEQAGA